MTTINQYRRRPDAHLSSCGDASLFARTEADWLVLQVRIAQLVERVLATQI